MNEGHNLAVLYYTTAVVIRIYIFFLFHCKSIHKIYINFFFGKLVHLFFILYHVHNKETESSIQPML